MRRFRRWTGFSRRNRLSSSRTAVVTVAIARSDIEQYRGAASSSDERRVTVKQNFHEFQAPRRAIEGYKAMHMIRKGQTRWVSDAVVRQQNQFIEKLFDLAASDLAPRFLSRPPPSPPLKVATLPEEGEPLVQNLSF